MNLQMYSVKSTTELCESDNANNKKDTKNTPAKKR